MIDNTQGEHVDYYITDEVQYIVHKTDVSLNH